VFTDGGAPATRRVWPYVLLFALILGAAGGAIALVIESRGRASHTPRDAGLVATGHDANVADALLAVPVAEDASVDALDIVVLVDAGHIAVRPTKDAAVGSTAIHTPNGRGTIQIQVITKPETRRSTTTPRTPAPAARTSRCRSARSSRSRARRPGYKPGKVQLVFDGRQEIALCALQRIKICIDNIKNPFDDCELDPTKPIRRRRRSTTRCRDHRQVFVSSITYAS